MENFNFGQAVEQLRAGEKVRRAGWKGKNMYIYLCMFEENENPSLTLQPCIVIKNAQGKYQPGWAPSQEDMLADDWECVKD